MSAYLDNRSDYERMGLKWWLNSNEAVDRAIIDDHCWERAGTDVVLARVKPGMTCIDVGANIGYYTLLLARQSEQWSDIPRFDGTALRHCGGGVLAFEPMAEPYDVLVRHVADNCAKGESSPLHRVEVHRFAVSDTHSDDETPLAIPYSCPRVGVPQNIPSAAPRRRLDDVLIGVPKIDFVKIDTDGHEMHVLRGGARMIERDHPEILLEVGDWFLRHHAGVPEQDYRYGDMTRNLFAWLEERGYSVRWEGEPDTAVSAETLLARHDLEHNTVNVLAVWRDR